MILIQIDPKTDLSLSRQIYLQIRSQILNGTLAAGFRLPGSRELAADLQVARNTVLTAYELLMAEGFISGQHGSGTYVAADASLDATTPPATAPTIPVPDNNPPAPGQIDFRSGIPAIDQFQSQPWIQANRIVWQNASVAALGYGAPAGQIQLRELICGMLRRNRGVICQPEQLLITSGSVQGLALVAKALVSRVAQVIVEDPANQDIARIFADPVVPTIPVAVDQNGLMVEALTEFTGPSLIVITPSHQFPLGSILPINRRVGLIRHARDSKSWIIEDDYDSEFRYDGPPLSAVQGLDPERVIYLGTFSKTLFPSLRLGYMVLPRALAEAFGRLKKLTDIHCHSLNQLVLAELLVNGYVERHVFRMKKLYRQRRDCLIRTLQTSFPDQVRVSGASTGLHLIAEFEGIEFDPALVERCRAAGVVVYPVENYAVRNGLHRHKLVLGYGHLNETRIQEGIHRLKRVIATDPDSRPLHIP